MTPCEERGYEVGQVFEVVDINGVIFSNKSIIILTKDNNSDAPLFDLVKGSCQYYHGSLGTEGAYLDLSKVRRIYPPEEPEEQVETITLFGKEYSKKEIENALKDVLPVEE